jgi:predicted transcriptional regulator
MPKLLDRTPRIKRSVILDTEENEAINEIVVEERRSFNSVVRQAIAEFLARRKAKQEAA